MGGLHVVAEGLVSWSLGIECSRNKHIIPAHRPGVPGSYSPRPLKREIGKCQRRHGRQE